MAQIGPVLVDGIIYSAWLFIAAVGLTLIYGVMKIVNVTHGSFYALGAYAGASLTGWWLARGFPPMLSYAVLLGAAVLITLAFAPAIERLILRYMYVKDEVVILLITYALFLILEDVIKLIWGVNPYFVAEPYALLGSFQVAGMAYPTYNLILVALAALFGGGLAWFLGGTRTGKLLRAVIHDPEVSRALGVNVGRYYLVTFTIGSLLAALAGSFTAPTVSVVPGLGVEIIVLSFAVVVIGGLGSLPGAALGAVIVGLVRSISVHYMPQVELFVIFFVMAVVLAVRPRGCSAWRSRARYEGSACSAGPHYDGGNAAAAMGDVHRHHRARQRAGRARPDAALARGPGVVRASAVLLPRRLHRRRARALLRPERRGGLH